MESGNFIHFGNFWCKLFISDEAVYTRMVIYVSPQISDNIYIDCSYMINSNQFTVICYFNFTIKMPPNIISNLYILLMDFKKMEMALVFKSRAKIYFVGFSRVNLLVKY